MYSSSPLLSDANTTGHGICDVSWFTFGKNGVMDADDTKIKLIDSSRGNI